MAAPARRLGPVNGARGAPIRQSPMPALTNASCPAPNSPGPTRAARRTFGADTPLRPLMTGAGLLFAAVAAAVAAAAGQTPRSSEAARTPLTRRDMFLSFPRSERSPTSGVAGL